MNHLKAFEGFDRYQVLTVEDRLYIEDCLVSIIDEWNLREYKSDRTYTSVSKSVPDQTSDDMVFTGEYEIYPVEYSIPKMFIKLPFFAKGPLLDKFEKQLELFKKRLKSRGIYCYSGRQVGKREFSYSSRYSRSVYMKGVAIRVWDFSFSKETRLFDDD